MTVEADALALRCAELERELAAERRANIVQRRRSTLAYATLLARVTDLTEQLAAHEKTANAVRTRMRALEASAFHDQLTGLLNRRGFYAVAEQMMSGTRHRTAGALIFIDLDGFKAINDRHGHGAGDQTLRLAAEVLIHCFREADVIARLGGDEFVILATSTPERDLEGIAARLHAAADATNIRGAGAPDLAWSIGVVAFGAEPIQSLDTLMLDADRRMYVAKRDSAAHRVVGAG